ncbi:MAG TPA: Hint domain-containing protein [Candidatus Dormibacteraeota bacterium]|nr:Hint domain-containing protein [Candidatus Dormibacteraeota bacterium]
MRRALVAALIALVAVACGATSSADLPLTLDQLKFKVMDEVGPPAFCDPDFYPLARAGGEQASADAIYSKIRADSLLYATIVVHENLPAPPAELDEAQKLALYRAYKKLNALELKASDSSYAFDYTVDISYLHVAGTVTSDGRVIVISSKTQGSRPNCPICLSAGTLISTPAGDVVVTAIRPGMLVWTQSANGERVVAPVIEVGSTPVPASHRMVHLTLADGRQVWASPGHRTADGRPLGSLAIGDVVDGSRVSGWELVPYGGGHTYDLLPAGGTGLYWANGILLASTLTSRS